MKPDLNISMLALSAIVKANVDAQTKAALFRQSVFQTSLTTKNLSLSQKANQKLEELKYSLAASLQQRTLLYP